MKYLLLTPADVDVIRTALNALSHPDNDSNCPYPWYGDEGCQACAGEKKRGEALKHFDQLPWGEGKP
ncbi:hypothetical protein LCGC14_0919850 [marine sediment metagenome]|uniref:Uncharacterized protein n=1 Tax=marine sediment metagenome TaxID=412755 RepID=A0A0F9NR77_9ZZZZ